MIDGHGDDIYRYDGIRVNFSSNVYGHFSHDGLFAHLAHSLPSVANYPEPTPRRLEAAIARAMGLQPSQVMVTAGATEAIYLVAQTFRRSRSAILVPTFAEYADACRLHEHETVNIYSLDTLAADTQVAWLCNPNNPTGMVIPRSDLLCCIDDHPHTVFVVDASYAPFTAERMIIPAEAAEMPNVVMLHSMTKEYAVPGLRLGYATAGVPLLDLMRRQRMPWTVGSVAEAAGLYLLEHAGDYTLPLARLMCERERVARQLAAMGVVEVWPSDTHILLCRLRGGRADALKEWLARSRGLLIRDASNFAGLDASYFRIAVQAPEENDLLISAIAEWIAA